MTEELKVPDALELRAELEEMVRKDLLGPAGGLEEIVDERNVRGRYILGLLAPRGQTALPDEFDSLALDGAEDGQDGKAPASVSQAAATSMLPSSIGMTFTVDKDAKEIQLTAKWGEYVRDRSDEHLDKNEEPRLVWFRTPVEETSEPFALRSGQLGPWRPALDISHEVFVQGIVRDRGDAWSITIFLINGQTEPKTNKDEAWVFQPELIVRHPEDQAIFVKRQLFMEQPHKEPESHMMDMLYRQEVEFALGHGVAVHAELADGQWDRAVELRTEVIPTYEVERMQAPTVEDIPALGDVVLDMQVLSEVEQGGFSAALNPLANAYEAWLDEQSASLENPTEDLGAFKEYGNVNVKYARETLARIREGIELLDTNEQAVDAFQFTNRAMALQRVHGIYTRLIRQEQNPIYEELDIPKNRSWYPFQLAFVLINIAGLVDPTHSDRSEDTGGLADLLWFPTGGGKTEAYLGVAAFAMGIRRLQGTIGGLAGGAGVTVLMRYTLRLLTLQQFQRATALICAMEVIRREDEDKWGPEPFRIGLWVGQRSTPNWTSEAEESVKQDHNFFRTGGRIGGKGTTAQLTNCPWCGKPINPGKNIRVETFEAGRARTFQYCSDEYGECPFSHKASPDEGLPTLVVDEEIYRRLPSLLIATVDKFAQMPWKGETQMLFGRVNGYCPRHGYRSPEINDKDSHQKKGYLPAVKTQKIDNLRPPDLIIQDELHLISGPLGTLVGLYETAVDHLCNWEIDSKNVYPKVIASTATIRRAKDQVYNVFQRDVKIFPPSGIDVGDNFFSRRVPSTLESPARRYIGICAPGTRLKAVMIQVYSAFMSAAQVLYEKYGRSADPWMTLVGYFNSMRELGGMRRVSDDSLRTRLTKMKSRGLANRYIGPFSVQELTSRKSATEIPKILDQLEAVFDPALVVERKERRKAGEQVDFKKNPIDIVLATNMISVGVDINRLGLMVVANQPKATAEYIQATSRVGRAFPGLVCTVYNWARPRDLSHYVRFEHYHATFYKQVEALSVTPFSSRALDRGLSAVLVSALRLVDEDLNSNEKAQELSSDNELLEKTTQRISKRAGLINGSQAENHVRQYLQMRIDEWLSTIRNTRAPAVLGYATRKGSEIIPLLQKPEEEDWESFTCLNSLRDVEPEVALVLNDYGLDREEVTPQHADEETNE